MAPVFDVFLSHNSKDKPAVRELADALRARGLNGWLDEWELVPGGRFRMGGNAFEFEKPVHWVRLSPFWLGETPVTNQQYARRLVQFPSVPAVRVPPQESGREPARRLRLSRRHRVHQP